MDAIIDPIVRFMEDFVAGYGYLAVFVLMTAESALIPFPSEVTMLVGGWYSADGTLDFFWVVTAGVVGNLVGSWLAYALGRVTGRALLDRYGKYVLIRSHDVDRAEIWWAKHGDAATFFSRLLPVIRTFISLPAGIAKMPLGKFSVYTFLGVVPWTAGLTYIGVVVEDNWEQVLTYFDVPTLVIGGAIVIGASVWYLRRRKRASAGAGRGVATPLRIGVLASHEGTNLQAVLDAIANEKLQADVAVVISNNEGSGALERARRSGVAHRHLSGKTHPDPEDLDTEICATLQEHGVDLVLLAGYMKKLGPRTRAAFRNRIVNVHPALLPRYGGKGMYGIAVHRAVLEGGEDVTGATIHVVGEDYDEGPVVSQKTIPVRPDDTPETLSDRVREVEHQLLVETLQAVAEGRMQLPEN